MRKFFNVCFFTHADQLSMTDLTRWASLDGDNSSISAKDLKAVEEMFEQKKTDLWVFKDNKLVFIFCS